MIFLNLDKTKKKKKTKKQKNTDPLNQVLLECSTLKLIINSKRGKKKNTDKGHNSKIIIFNSVPS